MAPERVDAICIVGGGDAGLLAALALEQGVPETDITVVDDFEESVPEVGKSTLYYLVDFLHNTLAIDPSHLFAEVDTAWKTTVYFEDWCGVGPFHSPLGNTLPIVDQPDKTSESTSLADRRTVPRDRATISGRNARIFDEFYYRYQKQNFETMYGTIAETPGKTPLVVDPDNVFDVTKGLPDVAYHFNARSLNRFLRELCRDRGITLVDDRIDRVETDNDRIRRLHGQTDSYTADLYVDASGFRHLLMTALGNELRPFDLPVDAALVTTTDIDLSEVTSATVITSADAGWCWQIDTCEVRDLGYVYSTDHISTSDAREEFVAHRPELDAQTSFDHYTFDSGVLATPWMNNCVGVGNAAGFVEPLQSTALTTSALTADRIAAGLGKHGRYNHAGLRDLFNDVTHTTWDEVYRFISLYYKYASGDTPFWTDATEINPEPTPQYQSYQASGFTAPEDYFRFTRTAADLNNYYLYYLILRELGVDSEFYESLDHEVDPEIPKIVDEHTASLPEKVEQYLSYEEFEHGFG